MARGRLGKLLAVIIVAGFGYACLLNVKQHENSGKDHRWKKAKKVKLDAAGNARVKGIVTYPGGDRVDWKVIETPSRGSLKIRLKWRPPRKGLDLAFNVYDQYLKRVKRAKPTPKKNKRSKRVKLRRVEKGKYYIQIYAPRRKDAGKYTLIVRFKPAKKNVDAGPLRIPSPPRLAAIPVKYDAAPAPDAPPPPDGRLPPIIGTIVGLKRSGATVRIRINRGKNAGVKKNMTGWVLRGSSQEKMNSGSFTIYRVYRRYSLARVRLTLSQLAENKTVRIDR